jgi:hypothetical protein
MFIKIFKWILRNLLSNDVVMSKPSKPGVKMFLKEHG